MSREEPIKKDAEAALGPRRLAGRPMGWAEAFAAPPVLSEEQQQNLSLAETIVRARDLRGRILGKTAQFADPAWDILLDLYVGLLKGRMISIGDACIAARVPMTTAFRWIDHLVRTGAVERDLDPRDGRRVLVRLSEAQLRSMDEFFRAISFSTSSVEASSNRSSSMPSGK